MTQMLEELKPLIVSLRRGIDVETNWATFRGIVEGRADEVRRSLTTRWLVSVCDTYVDLGTPIEQRNAMLITTITTMEKVAQSYVNWRVNYDQPFIVPADHEPRKIRLWDGMTSMHLEIGDVTNNLFRRLVPLLESTPHLKAIFDEIAGRIEANDTVLGTLNKRHGHVFEPHVRWRDAPRYDKYRDLGELPPLSPS